MSKKHVDKTYSKLLSRMTLLNTNTVHLKHLSGLINTQVLALLC